MPALHILMHLTYVTIHLIPISIAHSKINMASFQSVCIMLHLYCLIFPIGRRGKVRRPPWTFYAIARARYWSRSHIAKMMPSRGIHALKGNAPRLYQQQCRNVCLPEDRTKGARLTPGVAFVQTSPPSTIVAINTTMEDTGACNRRDSRRRTASLLVG